MRSAICYSKDEWTFRLINLQLNKKMPAIVFIRGGGDLASGVALRLFRAGLRVLISELPQPLAVRRTVSFAEAVYARQVTVEGVTAKLVIREQVQNELDAGEIPVIIDPDADILKLLPIPVVIDGRLTKQNPAPLPVDVPLHIGLGPGFYAGRNCHAVIETRRSHTLGRVYWNGKTQPDSGHPEGDPHRVLRAPAEGQLIGHAQIGDHLERGDLIAEIKSPIEDRKSRIVSPFKGVLRGLVHPGLHVTAGLKIGDIDARDERETCFLVSDKALAIGGGVLEAILSSPEIRSKVYGSALTGKSSNIRR
jgi:xanthine dehydrogenase accessory factor